ncbi:hypothetical protein I553_6258 [Mycobacterium xenopi 4042]|uniref:Uncharacterized protein n=1 Tax=Mycobacterium xenopi 4042 TaxID=1299334 RepID=X8BGP6_MYCXE|nr:hypothetical protein I553_6258 [Mycobacterium xenopi 4042]
MMRELDNLRHQVTGKILLPVEWSPLQEVDLARVPTDGATHPLSLFMEDTGWPYAPLDDYIRSWDEIYYRPLSQAPRAGGCSTSKRASRLRTAATNGARPCCGRRSTRLTTTRRWCTC